MTCLILFATEGYLRLSKVIYIFWKKTGYLRFLLCQQGLVTTMNRNNNILIGLISLPPAGIGEAGDSDDHYGSPSIRPSVRMYVCVCNNFAAGHKTALCRVYTRTHVAGYKLYPLVAVNMSCILMMMMMMMMYPSTSGYMLLVRDTCFRATFVLV